LKEFDLLNEEIKKKNSESIELQAIFSNETIKINNEFLFSNVSATNENNVERSKKEESTYKKIKKVKNRV